MNTLFIKGLVVGILSVGVAFGQGATAQIVGRTTDSSSSPVADAAIKVTNVNTGSVREGHSSDSGAYVFPLLVPGSYRLTVGKDGFRPVTRTGITLFVDQVARIDQELELGVLAQAVQVEAGAPLLESETSAIGQVVDSAKIQSILDCLTQFERSVRRHTCEHKSGHALLDKRRTSGEQ